MTFIKYPNLPEYFIIPFDEHYNDVALEMEFFHDVGIDYGVFFDEVINIVYNNMGHRPTPHDFEDIDYLWVSTAYDTYLRNGDADDLELFHSIYAGMVEKLFLCIYSDLESIMFKYGVGNAFLIEFSNFMHKDIILKVAKI